MNLRRLLTVGLILLYLFFCYLMLEITLQYIPFDTDVAFLRIKQDYIHLNYYKWAFFIHVYTSFFVLLAGFTQFFPSLQQRWSQIHRLSGWLYIIVVLLFAAPSGFIIGIHANGGFYGQLAFCLLALFWFFFTLIALIKIKKRDLYGHRNFMIRSFALTLSAITLRLWKYILVMLFQPRPMDVYLIVAWLAWVGNLLIAEAIIYSLNKKELRMRYYELRVDR